MTTLRLASAAEARTVLEAEDDFTRALGSFDRSFRIRTTASVSDAQLREALGEQAMDFTADEAEAWQAAIADVSRAIKGIEDKLPAEVLIAKTTGREERNHAYTRANMIFLPATRVQQLRGERAIYLVAHELFHVASRTSPSLRDATYALLGFTPIAPIPLPPELDARRMTNPDAYRLDHFLSFGVRAFVPLLICPTSLEDALGRKTVLEAVQVSLLAIDPDAGAALRTSAGAPIVVAAHTTEWSSRLARNTKYTIHPEEVLADNHALLVRRRLGSTAAVTDPAFLSAFEEAIAAPR